MNTTPLVITSLVLTCILIAVTLPLFVVAHGTQEELPFSLLVLLLGILGITSTEMAFVRRGRAKSSHAFTVTALMEALLFLIVVVYIFVDADVLWYPITALVLGAVLVAGLCTKIHRIRMRYGTLVP